MLFYGVRRGHKNIEWHIELHYCIHYYSKTKHCLKQHPEMDTLFCAIVIPFGSYSIKDKPIKQHDFNPFHDSWGNQHAFEMFAFNDSLCNYIGRHCFRNWMLRQRRTPWYLSHTFFSFSALFRISRRVKCERRRGFHSRRVTKVGGCFLAFQRLFVDKFILVLRNIFLSLR